MIGFYELDSFLIWFYFKGSQFYGKEKCKGRIYVVTGANSGIGKEIVRELNYRGAVVYMACRSMEKGYSAIDDLVKLGCSADRLHILELDQAHSNHSVKAYGRSKLAQVMYTVARSAMLRREGYLVTINACIQELLIRHYGAQTPLYCLLSKELGSVSGKYFCEMKQAEVNPLVENSEARQALFEYSLEACNLLKDEKAVLSED
ncbi:Retinol dehydrogenase [Trichinella spiralis]|uniref:Retinol dehydrogenase n=1 Tax=Trichinella spiralis TaxID=6334 RepID=A0ABR3KLG5_TRISP